MDVTNSVATANGYVYVVGGTGANTTFYAKINADGSIGTWQTSIITLVANRELAVTTVANGYIYVIGGYQPAGVNTIYYAKLNADGSISALWSTNTNTLPASVYGATGESPTAMPMFLAATSVQTLPKRLFTTPNSTPTVAPVFGPPMEPLCLWPGAIQVAACIMATSMCWVVRTMVRRQPAASTMPQLREFKSAARST